jgi:ribosomal protein S27AE
MMGFGFLFMLVLVAFPIVGIVALALWLYNANRRGNPFPVKYPSEKREQAESPELKPFCSHCGAGLQGDWTHCPQCGAGIGS